MGNDSATVQNIKMQMRKGVLEYCVLLLIGGARLYSSDLLEELKRANLLVVEGTLYPLLSRLRANGLIDYVWEESEKGPPRKYFHLTGGGSQTLAELNEAWCALSSSVGSLRTHREEDDS